MTEVAKDPAAITEYHAHIYYDPADPESRARAARLCPPPPPCLPPSSAPGPHPPRLLASIYSPPLPPPTPPRFLSRLPRAPPPPPFSSPPARAGAGGRLSSTPFRGDVPGEQEAPLASLLPQRNHRLDAHRTACRNVTGGQRDSGKQNRGAGERKRIRRADSVEFASQQARQSERGDDAYA